MKGFSKILKVIAALVAALGAFLITALLVSSKTTAGKALTQTESAKYYFVFILVYAVLAMIITVAVRRTSFKGAFVWVFGITGVIGVLGAIGLTIFDTAATVRLSPSDVAKNCAVIVSVDNGHGSGFSVAPDRIITNNHVIEGSKSITVHYDRDYSATVVKTSKEKDIAILQIEHSNVPACTLANSDELSTGQDLYMVGWPNDPYGEATVTKGIFSRRISRQESNTRGIADDNVIQTDASINPGNSGGPVTNDKGIVGMSVAKQTQNSGGSAVEGIGFAISSNSIAEYLK